MESLTNVLLIPGGKTINEDLHDYMATSKVIPFKINNNSGYLQQQRTAEETYDGDHHHFHSKMSSESSLQKLRESKVRSN